MSIAGMTTPHLTQTFDKINSPCKTRPLTRSSSLLGTGDVDQAAIFNSEGTSVWATSTNFNVTPQELKDIVAGFKDAEKVQSSGVHVAGVKYMTIKADDSSIYGKKVRPSVRSGQRRQPPVDSKLTLRFYHLAYRDEKASSSARQSRLSSWHTTQQPYSPAPLRTRSRSSATTSSVWVTEPTF